MKNIGFQMGRHLLTVLFSLFLLESAFGQATVWPTDASRIITSSFGEYRSGHFHAGIDFKTWGRTGYKVFAIGDGSVVRVRVSPYGYGRAVYLRMDNGIVVVYAHLSRFSEQLEHLIKKEQKRRGRFTVERVYAPGDLRVARGDVLGYTGRSGTRDPHLHFEVRDEESRPFNPLYFMHSIEDTIAPAIRAVAVTPLHADSHVEGDFQPCVFSAHRQSHGTYTLDSIVTAWGKIGFSVSASDRANGAPNRFAPYRVRLFVDDRLIFTSRYERFSYSQTRQVELDRDYRLNRWGKGLFQKLYRDEGNDLPFYEPASPEAGILTCRNDWVEAADSGGYSGHSSGNGGGIFIDPGEHTVRIEVADYFGNRSDIQYILRMIPLPEVSALSFDEDPSTQEGSSHLSPNVDAELDTHFFEDYVRIRLQFDEPPTGLPTLFAGFHQWDKKLVPLVPIHRREFAGALAVEEGAQGILTMEAHFSDGEGTQRVIRDEEQVFSVTASEGGTVLSDDGRCSVFFPQGSVYRSLLSTCRKEPFSHPAGFIDYKYDVFPQDIPLRRGVKIVFDASQYDGDKQKLGVYQVGEDGNVSFAGSRWEDGQMTAWIGGCSGFTMLVDTVSPQIDFILPEPGARIKDRTPRIAVGFRDTLSGISDEEQYIIHLDNRRLIIEYDPFHKLGFHPVEEPLTPGEHVIHVLIRDHAGNAITRESVFYVE